MGRSRIVYASSIPISGVFYRRASAFCEIFGACRIYLANNRGVRKRANVTALRTVQLDLPVVVRQYNNVSS